MLALVKRHLHLPDRKDRLPGDSTLLSLTRRKLALIGSFVPHYIGEIVWNRKSGELKEKVVNNPPDQRIRTTGAGEPIIEQSLFDAGQAILREPPKTP